MAEDTVDLWYYEHGDTKRGPVKIDVLKALLAGGEIAHTARVWNASFRDGVPANRVPQLCFLEDVDQILSGAQPSEAREPSHPVVMRVTCRCGKRLKIPEEALGRRVRCPKCGEALDATITSPKGSLVEGARHRESQVLVQSGDSTHRSSGVIAWLAGSLIIAAGIGIVSWVWKNDLEARRRQADEKVASAIAEIDTWLAEGAEANPREGEKLKEVLEASLRAPHVTAHRAGWEKVARLTVQLETTKASTGARKQLGLDGHLPAQGQSVAGEALAEPLAPCRFSVRMQDGCSCKKTDGCSSTSMMKKPWVTRPRGNLPSDGRRV